MNPITKAQRAAKRHAITFAVINGRVPPRFCRRKAITQVQRHQQLTAILADSIRQAIPVHVHQVILAIRLSL